MNTPDSDNSHLSFECPKCGYKTSDEGAFDEHDENCGNITDCPRCEGSGIYNFGKCSLCDGTGELNVDGEPNHLEPDDSTPEERENDLKADEAMDRGAE